VSSACAVTERDGRSVCRAGGVIPNELISGAVFDPRMIRERSHAAVLFYETTPGLERRLLDDMIVVEQAVGQVAFPQLEPHALRRVEFRSTRRQRHERHSIRFV